MLKDSGWDIDRRDWEGWKDKDNGASLGEDVLFEASIFEFRMGK